MKLAILHQFGPHKSHCRVVKEVDLSIPEQAVVALVTKLNKRFGIKSRGKKIYPRIGQKFAVYNR